MNRHDLSKKYAHGLGLEVAGLDYPWPVSHGAYVLQMDKYDVPVLRETYPELSHKELVHVDILDDANYCQCIADNTFDFVLSSHVLEHLPETINGLKNWLRILKPGGHLLLAVPTKNNRLDANRKETPANHVWEEYASGSYNLEEHYCEYFQVVDRLEGRQLAERLENAMAYRPHIHFHCWEFNTLSEMMLRTAVTFEVKLCEIELAGIEAFFVLGK